MDVVAAVFNVRKATGEWSVYTTVISVTLKTIALLIAGLADGGTVKSYRVGGDTDEEDPELV